MGTSVGRGASTIMNAIAIVSDLFHTAAFTHVVFVLRCKTTTDHKMTGTVVEEMEVELGVVSRLREPPRVLHSNRHLDKRHPTHTQPVTLETVLDLMVPLLVDLVGMVVVAADPSVHLLVAEEGVHQTTDLLVAEILLVEEVGQVGAVGLQVHLAAEVMDLPVLLVEGAAYPRRDLYATDLAHGWVVRDDAPLR